MHNLNFPGFTTATKLDTHGVGVDTGFIMSIFVNLSNSFLRLLLIATGTFRGNLPVPSKTSANSFNTFSFERGSEGSPCQTALIFS
jgi:hypothetical protein